MRSVIHRPVRAWAQSLLAGEAAAVDELPDELPDELLLEERLSVR